VKFADFHAGQVLEAGPHVVDQAAIVAFARDYDPQWFHVDPEGAQHGPFDGLIASGWHTCGIAMRLAVDHFLDDSESYASPGVAYIRWPAPVRPGDALTLRADVLETRRSRTRPSLGIVRWRWRLINQHATEVLDMESTSMFDLSREAPLPR